jgi:hypothetical protein
VLVVEKGVTLNINSRQKRVRVMQINNMTVDELKAIIRDTVQETLEEFFVDPDEGLEIREEVKQKLIESQKQIQGGKRGIPAEDVYKRLGLKST